MASFVVLGVVGFVDAVLVGREFDDVGVLGLKSRLLITIFGLYSIRSVAQNLACMFFSFIEVKKVCLKVRKKLSLVIYVKCIYIIFLISFSYTVFKGLKHFTSRG